MIITNKLRERFCTDYKIPINIFIEPYFSNRLELLNRIYGTIEKWNRFVEELQKYPDEQAYFEDYNRIKDEAIHFIQSTDAYKRFNTEDMNKYAVSHKNFPNKDIYKPANHGRRFISIDMKKANFSSLRHYDADIFGGAECWEDFLRKFTDNEHIINSKYIRQVILGNCNPKRHITYEKHLMDTVLSILENDQFLKEKGITLENVVFFSNDEIVIDITENNLNPGTLIRRIVLLLTDSDMLNIPFRIELFALRKIDGISNGYLKNGMEADGKPVYSLKGVNANMVPFVVRELLKQDIKETDKVFYHEGMLAKYIEVPEITIYKS